MARPILKLPKVTTAQAAAMSEDHDAVDMAFDNDLDLVKVVTAGGTVESVATATNTLTLTNKTLTSPASITRKVSTAGSSLTSSIASGAASGSTFALNAAAGFSTTLPSLSGNALNGTYYRFVVRTAPTGGTGYVFVTTSSANAIVGNVSSADLDAGADAAWEDDGDTITFVNDAAAVGDWIEVVAVDSFWFVSGSCKTVTGITLTKAS